MLAYNTYSFHQSLARMYSMDFEQTKFCSFFLMSPLVFSLAIDFPTILISHPKKMCTKKKWNPKQPSQEFFKCPKFAHKFPNFLQSSHRSGYVVPSK